MRYVSATLSLLVPCLLVGQQMTHPRYAPHPDRGQYPATDVRRPQSAPRALDYYNETFDTGLNGWTASAAQGQVVWAWTNTGPGTTTSTYPVPPLNTTTGGWAMVDDDFLGSSGQATEVTLTSPVIDLSGAPSNLKLEFDQYFQEWQNEHCFVGVSTDGGATWNEMEVNQGVGRDGRPNPEAMDLNISDWVAGDPSNVQIRFRYVSEWDYGWQVDNVTISDLPDNDLAVIQPRQTSFNFSATGLENIDHSIYPLAQVRPMLLHTKVRNKGFMAQHNVVFHVSVSGPGGVVFTGSSTAIAQLDPNQEDSLAVEGFTPSAVGDYTVTFSVTQDETDEIPENNSEATHFAVSDCSWAGDDGVCEQYQGPGADFEGDEFEVGNFIDIAEEGSILYAIDVAVYNNSTVGSIIHGVVRDGDQAALAETDDHEIQANELSGLGEAKFIRLTLTEPYPLTAGEAVLVMAGSYGGSDVVNFATSGLSDAQVTIINYPGTGDVFYFTKTPMVRAVLAPDCADYSVVGVSELPAQLENVSVAPNPFAEQAALRFTLKEAGRVRITLQDVTGRLVLQQDLGRLSAGPQQFRIDGALLEDAAYAYTITVDGRRMSGMLVHQGH